MASWNLLDDGTLDTVVQCCKCGKTERFDTHSLWEIVDGWAVEISDGFREDTSTTEMFADAIRESLADAGHHSEGCES
jgi:hypothetical protein